MLIGQPQALACCRALLLGAENVGGGARNRPVGSRRVRPQVSPVVGQSQASR